MAPVLAAQPIHKHLFQLLEVKHSPPLQPYIRYVWSSSSHEFWEVTVAIAMPSTMYLLMLKWGSNFMSHKPWIRYQALQAKAEGEHYAQVLLLFVLLSPINFKVAMPDARSDLLVRSMECAFQGWVAARHKPSKKVSGPYFLLFCSRLMIFLISVTVRWSIEEKQRRTCIATILRN